MFNNDEDQVQQQFPMRIHEWSLRKNIRPATAREPVVPRGQDNHGCVSVLRLVTAQRLPTQGQVPSPLLSGASLDELAGRFPTAEPTVSEEYRGAYTPCPLCHWWDLVSASTEETQLD